MGCGYKISASTSDLPAAAPRPLGDPNPHRFELITSQRIGRHYLAEIRYPDCTNYEGLKVLVLDRDPRGMKVLDPHFAEGGPVVARFAPTPKGLANARLFLLALAKGY